MSSDLDFDPEELAMLRQLFSDEAQAVLDSVTRAVQTTVDEPSPSTLDEMMRVTHSLKGAAGTVGRDDVVDLAHRIEGALAYVRSGVLAWRQDSPHRIVEILDATRAVVVGVGSVTAATTLINAFVADRTGTLPPPISDAEPKPSPIPAHEPAPSPTAASEPRSLLRVEASRVDDLMSAAGELLFDRTRIERRVQALRTLTRDFLRSRQDLMSQVRTIEDTGVRTALLAVEADLAGHTTQLSQATAALVDDVETLRRTIGDLQRGLTRIRMQSARTLFAHLAHSVRATARAIGARVDLKTDGHETEFDKAVAEQIVDPLIQLLRNAVVHGIEPPEARRAQGKPTDGVISLSARSEGNLVVIEVQDDGRGIDPSALRRRFVETGKWSSQRGATASDDDVLAALFDPGVTSRDDADELAGRGIGLDIVRQTVSRLGGEVRLASSPGNGTRFTLRLPTSTAVMQATLFKLGGQGYALADVHVIDTVTVEAEQTHHVDDGTVIPIVWLARQLGVPISPGRAPGLLIEYAGRRLVCAVERVIGSREILVKPLGPILGRLAWFAGATISGSGKVQLIVDCMRLVVAAHPDAGDIEERSRATTPAGRALVVDDSVAIREAVSSILSREGWVVDVAKDGAEGLEMARNGTYRLVITDLEMPHMSGFELIRRLQQDPDLVSIPVLIITSRATPDARRRARDLGVPTVIAKPITRRKLLDAITKPPS